MTIRSLTLVAATFAVMVSSAVAAPACDAAQGCATGAAASNTGAPLRLNAHRKMPQPKRVATQASGAAAVPGLIMMPQPRLVIGGGWLASIYAMDPTLAPAEGAVNETALSHHVHIAQADEFNEVDRMADAVRVVFADELNEIDLAAENTSATTGQAASEPDARLSEARPAQEPLQTSWIVGLVLAFGGMIATASTLVVRSATSAPISKFVTRRSGL